MQNENEDYHEDVSNDFDILKSGADYHYSSGEDNWPWKVHQPENSDDGGGDQPQRQAFPIFVEEVFPVDPKPTQISSVGDSSFSNEEGEQQQTRRPVTNSPIIWIRQNPQIADVRPVPTQSNTDFSLLSHEVIDLTGNFKETKVVVPGMKR